MADLVLADPASDQLTCDGRTLAGDDLDLATLYCQAEHVVVLDRPGLVTSLNDDVGDFASIAKLHAGGRKSDLAILGENARVLADASSGIGKWLFATSSTIVTPSSGRAPRALISAKPCRAAVRELAGVGDHVSMAEGWRSDPGADGPRCFQDGSGRLRVRFCV